MALKMVSKSVKFPWISRLCGFQKQAHLPMPLMLKTTKHNVWSRTYDKPRSIYQSYVSYTPMSTYEYLISQPNYCTSTKSKSDAKAPQKHDDLHKFPKVLEDSLNQQVADEFHAAFAYLSMSNFFGRTEVALPGCQGFFMNMYEEELGHATVFMNFILMRGARVQLKRIDVPENQDWGTITCAFSVAVELEKSIKDKLNNVFNIAEKEKDLQVMDLVSTSFMEEQNRSICELSRLLRQAEIVDNPVGKYLFDEMLYNSFVKKSSDNLMYKNKLADDNDTNKVYK